MKADTTPRLEVPTVLLVIAAFLAPLLGGQVSAEAGGLQGGFFEALGETFQLISGGNSDAPMVSHLVLATLVVVAFVWLMLRRRVVQVPNNTLGAVLLGFFGLATATTLLSNYKTVSISIATAWLTFGFAFYAVVGAGGRRVGARAILTGLFAGCFVLALLGLREYGINKAVDATWRIFPLWVNSNAFAIILVAGFFIGTGLLGTYEKVPQLVIGLGTVFIGLAIFLAQSKGALLVLLPGCAVLALAQILFADAERRASVFFRWLGLGAMLALAVGAVLLSQRSQTAGAPLAHLTNIAGSADQSAGFRLLLWKSALALTRANPAGYGLGAFQFESARPGIATQTVLAHSSYLQLMVEGSILLPLLLIAAALLWLRLTLKGIRTIPEPTRGLLASIIVAVGAVLAHSVVDSDLSYYGIGLTTFMLMGVGLLLSADSVAPEFLFPALRRVGAAFAVLVLGVMGYFSFTESLRAQVRGAMADQRIADARAAVSTLQSIAPADGEAWFLAGQVADSERTLLEAAQNAVALLPSTRHLRFLAQVQSKTGDTVGAAGSYTRALQTDPNNLLALRQLAELQRKIGNSGEYVATLKRLIDVEKSSYYKIRSLPELVPTETFQARIDLADLSNDKAEKRRLLSEAVKGFQAYLTTTIPNVLRMSKDNRPFAGESLDEAKKKMAAAAAAAHTLQSLDLEAGDKPGAAEAAAAEAAFLGAIK